MCSAVMALIISELVTVYEGNRFNFYTGVHTSSVAYFLMGAALFFGFMRHISLLLTLDLNGM